MTINKDHKINNDLQNTIQSTQDRAARTPLKTECSARIRLEQTDQQNYKNTNTMNYHHTLLFSFTKNKRVNIYL
jgi:hypothetical protein